MSDAVNSITIQIVYDDGRQGRSITIRQGHIKLKALRLMEEAQKTSEWARLIPAIAAALGITPEEADEVTLADWQAAAAVLTGSVTVPNASAPSTDE